MSMMVRMARAAERKFAGLIQFLRAFIPELNQLAEEGSVLLVEGARDVRAMRGVGYTGSIVSVSSIRRRKSGSILASSSRVIILTDLDKEGGRLAAKYARAFAHRGMTISLDQRRRFLAASRGIFRHVENLKRFSRFMADLDLEASEI